MGLCDDQRGIVMSKEIAEKEADIMITTTIEYNKHDVLADLETSLKEVKLMRDRKKAKRSWSDFKKRMKDEMTEEK